MKLFIPSCLLMLFICLAAQAQWHATSPAPLPLEIKQADGKILHIMARGNGHTHWTETLDGYAVLKTTAGIYEYAKLQDHQLVPTGYPARDPADRDMANARHLLSASRHLSTADFEASHNARHQSTEALLPQSSVLQTHRPVPASGEVRILAILIDYPDMPHSYEASHFQRMFNEGIEGKRSFRDYFLQNSYGQLNLNVDVVGWVRAAENHAYYGDDQGKSRSRELVSEAALAAEAQGIDFADYDNDGDGDVDGLIIVHAGPGAEEGSQREYIWSHRWTVHGYSFDGKAVRDYTIQPETRIHPAYGGDVGIGIFCHEFGHLLNLPDLYDMDASNGRSNGIGNWGLMGTGNWLGLEDQPAGLSAWSKEKMGWLNPQAVNGRFGDYSLRPSVSHPDALRIETGHPGEYFLLENRQQAGYDAALPGAGLAIWHIYTDKTDLYPYSNRVNGDASLKGVDLEEADGRQDLDLMNNRGDAGDLFPAEGLADVFSFRSSPSSQRYFLKDDSHETGISIERISQADDGNLTFRYTRLFSESGTEDLPLLAFPGENKAPQGDSWHAFRLSRDAVLQVHCEAEASLEVMAGDKEGQLLSSHQFDQANPSAYLPYLAESSGILLRWRGSEADFSYALRYDKAVNEADSLALVALYEQTEGTAWDKKDGWLSEKVIAWEGIQVEDGRVVAIELPANELRGEIPEELATLPELRRIDFKNNELSGPLPALQLSEKLDVSGNRLSSIAPGLEAPHIRLADNRFTFTDLMPIKDKLNCPDCGDRYHPQAELLLDEKLIVRETDSLAYGLSIDQQVAGIQYRWYRDEKVVGEDSVILLSSFSEDMEGTYHCEITHPGLPSLTLRVEGLQLTMKEKAPQQLSVDLAEELPYRSEPVKIIAGSDAGLPVEMQVVSGAAELSDSLLHLRGVGEVVLAFRQAGNPDYLPAEKEVSIMVSKAAQELVFTYPDSLTFGAGAIPLNATLSTGLLPRYELLGGPGSLQDDSLLIEGAGLIRLQLSHPGNELYLPVEPVKANIYVNKAGQRISFENVADRSIDDGPLLLQAESNAGLPVAYRLLSGKARFVRDSLYFDEPGEVTIEAYQPGNDNYLAAEAVEVSFFVFARELMAQQVSGPELADQYYSPEPVTLNFSASSGLEPQFVVSGPVRLEDSLLYMEGIGEVILQVFQPGNEWYAPADTLVMRFKIRPAPQEVSLQTQQINDSTFLIKAEASSGLPVEVELLSGEGSLVEDTLIARGAGTYELLVRQEGNSRYQPAEPLTGMIEIEDVYLTQIEVPTEEIVSVYPNPTVDWLHVSLDATSAVNTYYLYNAKGSLLLSDEVNRPSLVIDMRHYRKGVYFLLLQGADESHKLRVLKK